MTGIDPLITSVRSSRHETKRATGWWSAQEEEQERRRPNRLCGLAGAEVGAAQTSGWASRHLVFDRGGSCAGEDGGSPLETWEILILEEVDRGRQVQRDCILSWYWL